MTMSGSTLLVGGGFNYIDGVFRRSLIAVHAATLDAPHGQHSGATSLALENRPNPFQRSTALVLTLPAEGPVTLEVFDMAGRVVSTLARRRVMAAGPQRIEFRPAGLASGVYLARLETRQGTVTRKLLVFP